MVAILKSAPPMLHRDSLKADMAVWRRRTQNGKKPLTIADALYIMDGLAGLTCKSVPSPFQDYVSDIFSLSLSLSLSMPLSLCQLLDVFGYVFCRCTYCHDVSREKKYIGAGGPEQGVHTRAGA